MVLGLRASGAFNVSADLLEGLCQSAGDGLTQRLGVPVGFSIPSQSDVDAVTEDWHEKLFSWHDAVDENLYADRNVRTSYTLMMSVDGMPAALSKNKLGKLKGKRNVSLDLVERDVEYSAPLAGYVAAAFLEANLSVAKAVQAQCISVTNPVDRTHDLYERLGFMIRYEKQGDMHIPQALKGVRRNTSLNWQALSR